MQILKLGWIYSYLIKLSRVLFKISNFLLDTIGERSHISILHARATFIKRLPSLFNEGTEWAWERICATILSAIVLCVRVYLSSNPYIIGVYDLQATISTIFSLFVCSNATCHNTPSYFRRLLPQCLLSYSGFAMWVCILISGNTLPIVYVVH